MDKNEFITTLQMNQGKANKLTLLHFYGYVLAEEEGFLVHKGIDAIHWHLVLRFGWPLSAVRSLSIDDLWFLLAERTYGIVLPAYLADALDPA